MIPLLCVRALTCDCLGIGIVELVFIPPGDVEQDSLTLRGDAFHHLHRVLRVRQGDVVCACDGEGWVYRARILRVGKDRMHCHIEQRTYRPEEFTSPVVLGQGIAKGPAMDLIVQKATELGVARLIPLSLVRSVPRPRGAGQVARLDRWRRIAREAAQQCGRAETPTVEEPQNLEKFLEETTEQPLKVAFWEGEQERSLKEVVTDGAVAGGVVLLVGPEGGLEAREVAQAVEAGFVPVSLGQRKLRTETAALAALAIVQYEIGEMG